MRCMLVTATVHQCELLPLRFCGNAHGYAAGLLLLSALLREPDCTCLERSLSSRLEMQTLGMTSDLALQTPVWWDCEALEDWQPARRDPHLAERCNLPVGPEAQQEWEKNPVGLGYPWPGWEDQQMG